MEKINPASVNRLWRSMVLLAGLAMAAPGRADMSPPTPPLIPAGFADSNGTTGFFAAEKGEIEAVNLENGQRVWVSSLGSWPLFTRHGWLAVAAQGKADAKGKKSFRVRFLKPQDGTLICESLPLSFTSGPGGPEEVVADQSGLGWGGNHGYFQLEAWAERPHRPGPNRSGHEGHLQLRWNAQTRLVLGIRPPDPPGPPVTGRVWVDPSNGKTETIPKNSKEPFGFPSPKLPEGWKARKGFMYWSWTSFGSAWTDKPRAAWITPGTAGLFSRETRAPFRLRLERWRPYEPLPPLELAEGAEVVPIVGLDERYAVLAEYKDGANHYRLRDLALKGDSVELPPFEEGVTWKFTVLGDLLLYVTEVKKSARDGGMLVERKLVALDWRKGQVRWRHALAPRYEAPPVAGVR